VESGPVTTVQEPTANGGRLRALFTRIFHWGSSPTPPAGAPLPPAQVAQCPPVRTQPLTPSVGLAQGTKTWAPAHGTATDDGMPIVSGPCPQCNPQVGEPFVNAAP